MHGSEPESESITYIHTYIHTQIVTHITHTGAPEIESRERKSQFIPSPSVSRLSTSINQSINQKCQRFEFSILSFSICSFSIFNFFFRSKLYLLYSTLPYPLSSPLTRDRIKLRH